MRLINEQQDGVGRRRFIGAAAGGMASVAALGLGLPHRAVASPQGGGSDPSAGEGHADILKEAAVGIYTDLSVAGQASSFSMNRSMVSCGVGTLAGPHLSGPFAMLMYATRIDTYAVVRAARTLRATGHMRSITQMAGQTVEDVEHEFIAIALDGGGAHPDRFDVHFRTPFWTPGKNPMATPSDVDPHLSRFGGELLIGLVDAGSASSGTGH